MRPTMRWYNPIRRTEEEELRHASYRHKHSFLRFPLKGFYPCVGCVNAEAYLPRLLQQLGTPRRWVTRASSCREDG